MASDVHDDLVRLQYRISRDAIDLHLDQSFRRVQDYSVSWLKALQRNDLDNARGWQNLIETERKNLLIYLMEQVWRHK